MDNGGLTTGDLALMGNNGFGGENGFMWIFGLLILMGMFNGGWGGNTAALGYQNLATQNDVQRGFDTAALQDQSRDILGAVNAGTAQAVAATNQVYHDVVNNLGDKYSELARDIAGVQQTVQQSIANQNACCCDTKMLIQGTAAENRYDAAQNTQKILDALAQNKIDALQAQVNQLQLQQATAGMLKFPTGWTYGAGPFPPIFGGCTAANI